MTAKKLTAQQEAFAQAYVAAKGKRGAASNAYRAAYPGRMGADAVASNAKKLLRSTPIRLRITELAAESISEPVDLTPKQEAFCRQYMETGNASEGYRRAYVVSPDTKPGTIYGEASKLLANPKISRRLSELKASLQRRYEVSTERAVEELAKCAYANMDDYIEYLPDGKARLDLSKVTRTQMAAVKKLTFKTVMSSDPAALEAAGEMDDEDGKKTVAVVDCQFEIADKKGYLDSILKHTGGFEKDNRQRGEAEGAALGEKLSDLEVARRVAAMLSEAVATKKAREQGGGPGEAHVGS